MVATWLSAATTCTNNSPSLLPTRAHFHSPTHTNARMHTKELLFQQLLWLLSEPELGVSHRLVARALALSPGQPEADLTQGGLPWLWSLLAMPLITAAICAFPQTTRKLEKSQITQCLGRVSACVGVQRDAYSIVRVCVCVCVWLLVDIGCLGVWRLDSELPVMYSHTISHSCSQNNFIRVAPGICTVWNTFKTPVFSHTFGPATWFYMQQKRIFPYSY